MGDDSNIFSESKSSYSFDGAASAMLKIYDELIVRNEFANEHDKSAVHAYKIFSLFSYLEAQLNNGFRFRVLDKNFVPNGLNRLIKDRYVMNVEPFQIVKFVDAIVGCNDFEMLSSKFKENFRFHNMFRNWVAHGLTNGHNTLIEWQDEAPPILFHEEEKALKDVVDFLRRNGLSGENKEVGSGPSYITNLTNAVTEVFFQANMTSFISALINEAKAKSIYKGILWTFDYEYFGLDIPYSGVKT